MNPDNCKSVGTASPEPSHRPFSQKVLLGGLLVVVCAVVAVTHWPALSAGAMSIDDNQYLTRNSLVQNPSWASAWRFLTEVLEPSTVDGYYQPLTMISLMLDYGAGGRPDNLLAFHRTSLALHVANTALVIVLLYLLFGKVWVAAGVGLLFGLHPMTVDPIPWVSERKTLLAAFFGLWCLILYVRFTRKGDWRFYVGCMVMYVLAVMSKPVSLPLPAVMLLMDYWPLGRWKRQALLEKLPFFVVGAIFAIITYVSQSRTCGAAPPSRYGPERIPLILCHNIIFYLHKVVWPANVSSFYPFPRPLGLSHPTVLVAVIGTCILISSLVISLRWTRGVLVGWLVFFVAILPTMQIIGFTDVIASNKFAYLPSIGFLIVLASFLGWFCYFGPAGKAAARRVVSIVAVVILAGAEAVATRRYLVYWRDTAGLYKHILTVAPDAIQVHNNLGNLLQSQGKIDEAISHYHQILRLEPNYFNAHYNLANALQSQGKFDEAASHYLRALQIRPKHFGAYQRRGILLRSQGKLDEAITHYRQALQVKPGFADAYYNLGIVLQLQGKLDEAVSHYRRALQIKPDLAEAHYSLGNALKSQGKLDEAVSHYRHAVRVKPDHFNAHHNLGNTLQSQGRVDEAIIHYRQALQAKPNFAEAHNSLGLALRRTGQLDGALKHFQEAVRLKPNYLSPLKGMALILATHPDPEARDANRAIELAERAAELTKHQSPEVLGTLAEAYAAAGQFERAVTAAQAALALASAARNDKLANHLRERLELYRQAKP